MSHIPFRVTVTLTTDLVLRIFVLGVYFLYSLRLNFKFGVYMHLGMLESHILFSGHCDLDL